MLSKIRTSIRKQFLLRQHHFLPSTAKSVRRKIARKGVTSENTTTHHVQTAYREMMSLPKAPDFERIAPVLKSLPHVEPFDTDILGVIIETRRHKNIELVLENFLNVVGKPVQFFHGEDNAHFLQTDLSADIRKKVNFIEMPVGVFDARSYNALLLSEEFWNSLACKSKILFFQTDALICNNSKYNIYNFLNFDYIGSLWPRKRPVGIIADGGNGGLSLRDWEGSVECLRRFPATQWKGGEDGYFAFHLELLGYRVAPPAQCARFSTQHEFFEESWGVHKPSTLKPADRDRFFEYCPEARELI